MIAVDYQHDAGHAIAGFGIELVTHGMTARSSLPRWARITIDLSAPVLAGVAKEMVDRHRGGSFSGEDVAFTAGGAVAAYSLTIHW
jgi:hypothetical protein